MNHWGVMLVKIILLNTHRLSWSGTSKSERAMMYNSNLRHYNCKTVQRVKPHRHNKNNNVKKKKSLDELQLLFLLGKVETSYIKQYLHKH